MSLQGWVPDIGPYLTVAEVIEHAFDYRGNVTLIRRDGSPLVGYLSNRDAVAPEPFVEMIDEEGEGPIRIAYADVLNIHFTGKDPAEGNSWKAWLERKEREKAQHAPSTSA